MSEKRRKLGVKLMDETGNKSRRSGSSRGRFEQWSGSVEDETQAEFILRRTKKEGPTCLVCFVGFCNSTAFRRHRARYRDPKYPCKECGTKFGNTKLLQSHIAFTHGPAGYQNYRMKCPVCNQCTHLEAALRSHICHVHKEWVETNFVAFAAENFASGTESSSDNRNNENAMATRHMMIKFLKHIIGNSSNNVNEIGTEKNGPAKDNSAKERSSEASRVYRDAESLRIRYSCKDCYIPLPRIDFRKNMLIKLVTPIRNRRKSPEKKPSYRTDESESREDMRPANRREEEKQTKPLEMVDVQVHLDKLPESTDIFLTPECDDYGNFETSIPVTDALEDCVDPLDLGEAATETTPTFPEYPTSFEFPVKFETPEVRTENLEQCPETPIGPLKVESMDCEESPEKTEYPVLQEVQGQPEPVQYYGEPSFDFTDATMETFEPVKVEIEEHPILEYPECGSRDATGSPEVPHASTATNDESSSSTSASQLQESWTMIASRICNKLFTNRRTMLRHFRKRHLSCFDDTVYCVCGKEMNGRRAMEKHFSQHCDRLIKTTRISIEQKLCKPLEKKYKCTKCDQKFWLPTCLQDHPPNCELPKPKPVNPCRLIKNINRAYGLTSHLGAGGEYICRICDVKFTSIDTLLRHLRSFSTNEKCPCAQCGTVFSGRRLLKGHVQSTHDLNSTTTYTYFCEICNQGFTKKINHRIHTRHIHTEEEARQVIKAPTNCLTPTDSGVPVATITPENQCNVCNLVFMNRKRYMEHVSYYNRAENYRCNICGQQFEGQYKAHHHRKKVHYGGKINPSYTHYCDLCKEGFTYKTHLHAHMFHVHDDAFNCVTSVKDYNLPEGSGQSTEVAVHCQKCSNKFSSVPLLLLHMDTFHGEDPTKISKVQCSHCDRQFATLLESINHLKHDHSSLPVSNVNDSQDLQCAQSNSSTPIDVIDIDISVSDEKEDTPGDPNAGETQSRETVEVNREKVANEKEDDAPSSSVCFTCGFDCPGPWGLARHKALYLNSGMYACEFCGRRFSWQTYYRDHKLKHFRRDVHNNYFCPVCDEGFDTITDLQMHAIHLHEEALDLLKCDPVGHTSRPSAFQKEAIDSNSIPDSHQPLTDTLGNDCEDKYEKFGHDQGKTSSIHKGNPVVESQAPQVYSNSFDRSPMCNICNMAFISNEMLEIHRENSHPSTKDKSSPVGKSSFPSWLSMAVGGKTPDDKAKDRFYVRLNGRVNAQTIDSIGRRITMCNENIGLTSKLYRYDVPLTCEVCDLTFQSKDMLLSHRDLLHTIEKNFVFKSTSDDGRQSTETEVVKSPQRKSGEHDGKTGQLKDRSTASMPALQSGSKRLQAANQPSTEIDENIETGIHSMNILYYYKCGLCDIIFNDKDLMTVHEQKVHGLRPADDDSLKQVYILPPSQPACIDNLWLGSKKDCNPSVTPRNSCRQSVSSVKPVPRNISPEEIVISDEETEVTIEPIASSTNPSLGGNKKSDLPPSLRLINLPPGNYKISKLKVRSTDTGKVTKLIRNVK